MCPAAAKAALATAATVATTGRDMATRRGGGGEQWGLDRSEERDWCRWGVVVGSSGGECWRGVVGNKSDVSFGE